MNISVMIDMLESLQDEFGEAIDVHLQYDYGDHGHNLVAPEICEIEATQISHSDYHNMPKIQNDERNEYPLDAYDKPVGDSRVVIVIGANSLW